MTEKDEVKIHDVRLGRDVLNDLNKWLDDQKITRKNIYVIADSNTARDCYPILEAVIGTDAKLITVEPVESSKSLEVVGQLVFKLSYQMADRDSLIINLGGGMITDLGGFVASVYMRGLRFVHIPTSLLGMADASVGGKTGINVLGIKNLIGTFDFPQEVFIHSPFLKTLPDEEWINGLAEVIKHAIIGSAELWEFLDKANIGTRISDDQKDSIMKLMPEIIRVKSDIVKEDVFDHGKRMALNFGHTLGHAIETAGNNGNTPISHGRAVAAGMICELYISEQMAGLDSAIRKKIENIITNIYGTWPNVERFKEHILFNIHNDKKRRQDKIMMSLLRNIGEPIVNVEVPMYQIMASVDYYTTL